jgi:hypothetical protein
MKTDKFIVTIEGISTILFDRPWQLEASLKNKVKTQGAVGYFQKEQFYTIDEEACFHVEDKEDKLSQDEFEAKQIEQIKKGKITPAIPIKDWLDGALFGVAGQVKVKGKKTIKDFINSTFTVLEKRYPIGTMDNIFVPEYIEKSLPADKGARHYAEKPGFNAGWQVTFTVQFWPEYITKEKIHECIEMAGWMKGIGARRKAGNGKFAVTKVEKWPKAVK